MMSATSRILIAGAALALAQAHAAFAQTPPAANAVGVLEKPCAVLEPMPAEVTAYLASAAKARAAHQAEPAASASGLAAYNAWQTRRALQDYAGLCHYHDQNAALPPASDHRVVFFGDSITELWGAIDPGLFTH